MKKVLLLYPQDSVTKEFMSERPPLGLAYLGAFLERANHEVKIVDLNLDELDNKDIIDYDVIGISFLTPFYTSVQELIKKIRAVKSDVFIILGGAHATLMSEQVLRETDVQLVVRGEAEYTFLEILENLDSGDFSSVKGITYFGKDGKVHHTESRPLLSNLDELPFPARHLLRIDRYVNVMHNERCTTIMTSRGCPYACPFCCQVEKRNWRPRSAKNVVDEIEDVYHKYNIKVFYFYDDMVTLDRQRIIDISKEVIDRGLKIKWKCASRVNLIDDEMVGWMRKSGCFGINFGVESGDMDILKKISKGINLDQVRNAFKIAKKHGIEAKGYFIIGFPWEKEEHVLRTINFSLTLDADELQYLILVPLPGTEIWDYAIREGVIDPSNVDWNEFRLVTLDFKNKVFFTNNISEQRLLELRKFAYRKAVLHTLKRKIRSGDVKYIYSIVREKWNLGLGKFVWNMFFSRKSPEPIKITESFANNMAT